MKIDVTHSFFIENWRPMSLNMLLKQHRYSRKKKDEMNVVVHKFRAEKIPLATGKRRVSIHINLVGRQKEYDSDNAWKVVLDGLVKCGALMDDKQEFCELGDVVFSRNANAAGTLIIIQDIEGVIK